MLLTSTAQRVVGCYCLSESVGARTSLIIGRSGLLLPSYGRFLGCNFPFAFTIPDPQIISWQNGVRLNSDDAQHISILVIV